MIFNKSSRKYPYPSIISGEDSDPFFSEIGSGSGLFQTGFAKNDVFDKALKPRYKYRYRSALFSYLFILARYL